MTNTILIPKGRIQWIDIAKFFGIFFVVYGHTFDSFSWVQQVLYLFHVPLFFFISGLTYRYESDQVGFIKKKIFRLYIPYLLTALVSIVVYLLMMSFIGGGVSLNLQSLGECLYGMIYANVSAGNMMWNRPLWFLPALLMALIITNLVEAIKNKPIRYIIVVLLAGLGYWLSANSIYLPLQTETALSMLVWVFMGILLKPALLKMDTWSKPKLALLIIPLAITGLLVGFYNGTISVMVDLYGKSVPLYIIAAFCLSLVTLIISMLIGQNNLLEYVGRNTLVILLWHKFPIEFFQRLCPVIKDWLFSPNQWIINTTALVVCLIAMASSILLKIIWQLGKKKFFADKAAV